MCVVRLWFGLCGRTRYYIHVHVVHKSSEEMNQFVVGMCMNCMMLIYQPYIRVYCIEGETNIERATFLRLRPKPTKLFLMRWLNIRPSTIGCGRLVDDDEVLCRLYSSIWLYVVLFYIIIIVVINAVWVFVEWPFLPESS